MLHIFCVALFANCFVGSAWTQGPDEASAAQWANQHNDEAQVVYSRSVNASWKYNTNITDHNQNQMVQESLKKAAFDKVSYQNASQWDWQNFQNQTLKRLFSKITDIGTAVLPDEKLQQWNGLKSEMTKIYSSATVCGRPGDADPNKCYPLEPDLTEIMSTSRNWNELVWAWKGWRDASGKKMKDMYESFTSLSNEAAKANGYTDAGEYWRSSYEMSNLESECQRLFDQIKPLYENLHAYVRRKLQAVYPTHTFPTSGHIPAHILGNMWAQSWAGVLGLVQPFPNKTSVDVSDELKRQGYNSTTIFMLSEEFFTSLGLIAMPDTFWRDSMLEKPHDGRQVVCHASAWDFYNRVDFRVKQCTEVNMAHMVTAHHEMGHVEYYLQYKGHHVKFRRGANPGFHEAIGDVLALSVSTPEHLHKIGLLDKVDNDTETDLNFLMSQALKKIAFLPFGYLIDQWRWSVFRNDTRKDTYNTNWWDLRCRYQGVSAPVSRSEEDFDPGAKFHVPNNTPYIRYFVSHIIQFQFHKALCEAAGNTRPLHRCDIYQSQPAGNKIGSMMQLGSSKPWPDAMEAMTGSRTMDAAALMEYFQPLTDWLQEQNTGHPVGWQDTCSSF